MTNLSPRQSNFSRTFAHTNGALTLSMLALCGMPLMAADQAPEPTVPDNGSVPVTTQPAPGPMVSAEVNPADGRRQALAEAAYVSGMKARDQATRRRGQRSAPSRRLRPGE